MRTIFDEIALNNLKLKNRLIRSATWEGLANKDGSLSQELIQIYEELAAGGVGAIICGFTSVSSMDYYIDGIMRLSDDSLISAYQKLTQKVKEHDCAILTQLALGEYRKEDSSGIARSISIDKLAKEDIENIINLFAQAAKRAQEAGFDGVQIHAAHGFFLSRFISPAYNHRSDDYGGSVQNRARILIDILNAIRKNTKEFHVSMKINCSDFAPAGLSYGESFAICQECASYGIDSIEVSGNGTSRSGIRPLKNEAYFLDFAVELKKIIDTPVILVGGHRSIQNMNNILNTTTIECLSLSRPLVREPQLPNRWKSGKTEPASCVSCNACYGTYAHQCIFRLKDQFTR